MHVTDTHLHLWDPALFNYSWCAGIPSLNRAFTIHDYLESAQGTGITKALFVECDVDEPNSIAEARHIAGIARDHPMIAGIIASGRPEYEDFPSQLEELLAVPEVKGIRRVLHVIPDDVSRSPLFSDNLNLLAAKGLTFDLCVRADQLPLAAELISRCDEVQFILDHCGVPDIKGSGLDPWREHIRTIAGFPNVICKVSGLPAYAAPGWSSDDLRPWTDHVISCFGFDRLVWGGDWPVCTLGGTLEGWVNASRELFEAASLDEQAKLFHSNATRVYGLSATSGDAGG
jgi:predicted TIM-barrel fold metal-dependent hydrolase